LSHGHTPRKRFGQHFLNDSTVLERIIKAFAPKSTDQVIEIGPGTGALTELLLTRLPLLTAIELDRNLIDLLQNKFASDEYGQLNIIQSDVLKIDFDDIHLASEESSKIRLIGNLPYNISTPLIFHLLDHIELFQDMVFMLQKEVADRLAAQPGSRDYGRLSVMTSIHLQSDCLFDVPPSAFTPPPKVNSTIIRMKPRRETFDIENRAVLGKVVTAGFSQRRKTIRNGLKGLVDDHQLEQAGIAPESRAETIAVQEWVNLANILSLNLPVNGRSD